MHRWLPLSLVAIGLSGCGSIHYYDNTTAVELDPMCAIQPDRPGEPIARRCERHNTIITGKPKSEPLDLKGASRKDDDPD